MQCGKYTNSKWKQSIKLATNPHMSIGRLMDERQWEGPTSHQAAVARDRLARDMYTLSEVDAADKARLAALQHMSAAAAAAHLNGDGTPGPLPPAQLPPRVGCYLAIRSEPRRLPARVAATASPALARSRRSRRERIRRRIRSARALTALEANEGSQ